MNADMRASVSCSMNAPTPKNPGFKRQVVVRLDAEEWPLLETAVAEHGSMQAAILAGLHALKQRSGTEAVAPKPNKKRQTPRGSQKPARKPVGKARPAADEEIPAREAAELLGIKPDTVRGYIRTGRLAGRYEGEPTWRGWLTTRSAIDAYRCARS